MDSKPTVEASHVTPPGQAEDRGKKPVAKKRWLVRRVLNRLLHTLARSSPGATSLRPWLHRLRGVTVGSRVFIGEDVYLDNEYPEAIEIQDGVQLSIRSMVIAHTRGPGRVIIDRNAFVGPNVVVACSADRTLRIGEGAVIGAGCTVTRSVPARVVLASPAARMVGEATVPLSTAASIQEFMGGLRPVAKRPTANRESAN
ncbi:MAG TPA: acyltransferase [Verrucomicrobiota bacterium]|nr:acyltransferase [Verrucomicrobiota bacterium]